MTGEGYGVCGDCRPRGSGDARIGGVAPARCCPGARGGGGRRARDGRSSRSRAASRRPGTKTMSPSNDSARRSRLCRPWKDSVIWERRREIRLWRGFVKCQLYATFRGIRGGIRRVEVLPPALRGEAGRRAQRALADLLAELERDGWTVVSDGGIWYQHRLQRGV